MPSAPTAIIYRPFTVEDGEALLSWASTADELLQWVGPRFRFPLDISQLTPYADTTGEQRHVISAIDTATGAVVGHAELDVLAEHELATLGRFAVAPEQRGHGLATPFIRWLIDLAFDELALQRLQLVVFDFNVAARRCYERAGFVLEGRARQARKASSGRWDLLYMGLLASERAAQSHR